MTVSVDDLLFGVRRSVRYHTRRRQFFDRFNTVVTSLSLVFGSATILAVLGNLGPRWSVGAAALVTVTSAINLVVGSTRMARLHHDLARKFIELEALIISVAEPSDEQVRKWATVRLTIEGEEPPVLRVLDCLCHNEQLRAMGLDAQSASIGWLQRTFAQFFDISAHTIKAGE